MFKLKNILDNRGGVVVVIHVSQGPLLKNISQIFEKKFPNFWDTF